MDTGYFRHVIIGWHDTGSGALFPTEDVAGFSVAARSWMEFAGRLRDPALRRPRRDYDD
jgi:hypothetical protein